MSAPGYDSYRDSGIDWLGPVPSHWSICKLKHVLSKMGSGGTPDTDKESFWSDDETGTPWVAIGDMSDRQVVTSTAKRLTSDGLTSKRLDVWPCGTLLFSMYASLGHTAVAGIPLTVNQAILALVPKPDVNQPYLKRWFEFLRPHLSAEASSNTQDNLNASKVANLVVALPPPAEQAAIAAFLDRETGKIDALVEAQTRLIELLKEKRQAVISHAVTKGLDPAAPMKDSGVEWLGDMPMHWDIVPLGYRFEVQLGRMLNAERADGENLRPYLRVFDVQWGEINVDDLPQMDFPPDAQVRYRLEPGDLLVNEGGSYVGRSAIWRGGLEECYYQKAIHRVRPRSGCDTTEYLFFVMEFATRLGVFVAGANQTTIDHLTAEQLRSYRFAFPPLGEQLEIAASLVAETGRFDDLLKEAEAAIMFLQERCAALISAAVTGKIDVREAAPRNNVVSLDSVRRASNEPSLPAVVGAYAIRELGAMGRMPVMKAAYLAEGHAGFSDLRGRYERQAAGPYDRSLISAMERGAWEICNIVTHEPREEGRPVTYEVPRACQLPAEALSALAGHARTEKFLAMLSLLKGIGRDGVEAVATIYAVWNDLLAAGKPADDNVICNGVLNDWDPEKSKKFTRAGLDHWLAWMRRNGLEPDGSAPRTDHQGSLFA